MFHSLRKQVVISWNVLKIDGRNILNLIISIIEHNTGMQGIIHLFVREFINLSHSCLNDVRVRNIFYKKYLSHLPVYNACDDISFLECKSLI